MKKINELVKRREIKERPLVKKISEKVMKNVFYTNKPMQNSIFDSLL
jgi:hypothetical protein